MNRKGCFKCAALDHIAEHCPHEARLCYNCKQPGHNSADCPSPRNLQGKQCYGCGGFGHVQENCPSLRLAAQGHAAGQKCYACGQYGHIARLCPTAPPPAAAATPPAPKANASTPEPTTPGAPLGSATLDGEPAEPVPNQPSNGKRLAPIGSRGPPTVPSVVGIVAARGGRGRGRGRGRGGFIAGGRGGFVNNGQVVICYKCGGPNHLARSCTAASPSAPVSRGPRTCYRCQEEGHIARDCPVAEETAA